MNISTQLDPEELMHLAIYASNQGQTEKAIPYLKQIIDITPQNGQAHYLLGALHAEIGLYDRAIDDMNLAVELDNSISIAHFQLGLLYLTSGRTQEAEKTWLALETLGEEEPLFLFKRGLLALAQNNYVDSINDLSKGITLNTTNESLNNDMQRMRNIAEQAQNENNAENNNHIENTGKHVLLSAYETTDEAEH